MHLPFLLLLCQFNRVYLFNQFDGIYKADMSNARIGRPKRTYTDLICEVLQKGHVRSTRKRQCVYDENNMWES